MLAEIIVGQLVYSKCGRDKKRPFIVVSVEDEYVSIADGKLRTVEKPKRKKKKHVQQTNVIIEEINQSRIDQSELTNSELRKAILSYIDGRESI